MIQPRREPPLAEPPRGVPSGAGCIPGGFGGATPVALVLGDLPTRQTGSTIRSTTERNGEHRITAPLHDLLRAGNLARTLAEVADHRQLARDELFRVVAE